MKIKLPTALRSALLAAMAFTAGTAYAAPFDPSVSPGATPGTTINGLLVGDSTNITCNLPDTVTTVRGDIVVGAGNRSQGSIQGGAGVLNIVGSLDVTGSIYAGASGNTSFGDSYVDKQGGDGTINVTLTEGETLNVRNAIRLGWLGDKEGKMTIGGGTTKVDGQIVLGFYNQHGGPSLGASGDLTIQSAAKVQAGREIFVASGNLIVSGAGSTLNGKHLELVGKETSQFMVGTGAVANLDEVLIGSYGKKAEMSVGGGIVAVDQDFQIYAGKLKMSSKGELSIFGDAMFGDKSEGGIDSFITIEGKSAFSSNTLSVWKDADLKVTESSVHVNGAAQIDGQVSLLQDAQLTVDSDLSLNDGAKITVDRSNLTAGDTYSAGKVEIALANDAKINGGNLTVESGSMSLAGSGVVAFDNVTTIQGNIIVGQDTQFNSAQVSSSVTNVAAGTSIQVREGATVSLGNTQLAGNLAIAGDVIADELNLTEGCGLTVASTGQLKATQTIVGASMALENTGNRKGTLGTLRLTDNVALDLKDNNKADVLTTAGGNTVTVSGKDNKLGAVTLNATSSLLVKGTGTEAEGLTSSGNVSIDSDLRITGSTLSLKGTTTISGSLRSIHASWNNTGNAPMTLLINGNTKSSDSSAMLELVSGIDSDSFNVQVDMTKGIADLSGKQVVFAKSGKDTVTFNKTDANFKFLSDGTITEERGDESHVTVVQQIGSTKTYYGYTFSGNYSGDAGTNWNGTSIKFDKTFTNEYKGANEQTGKVIVIDNERVATEKLDVYDKAILSSADSSTESVIVSKGTGTDNSLNIGTQILKLKNTLGEDETTIGTGAKTWEVSDTTVIDGQGTDRTVIGGFKGQVVSEVQGADLGQLNITSGTSLQVTDAKVEIGQTLSMGEGSSITAKGSEIHIGASNIENLKDVSFEVPKYENGQLVTGPDGQPVMEVVTLSQELTQKSINNVILNLEDTQFTVDSFKVMNDGKELSTSSGIVFNNATVITTETQEGKMEFGSGNSKVEFNNSHISGTGTLNNIVMNGGTLMVGNSPGTRYAANSTFNSTELEFFIDPSQVTPNQLEYGPAGDVTSLLVFNENVTITGVSSVSIRLQVAPDYTPDVDEQTFANQYSANFIDGMSFQVIDKDSLQNVTFTGTLVDGSLPTLQDGLVWDYSKLFTDGTIGIAKGSYADAARIANTLVSAGETVSGFGQMSRSHVYDVRLNGTNVWANGLGTFLNHSSHNGRTGFEYNAGGYAVGADTIVDNKAVVGVAFGQSFGKHTPKAGNRFFDAGHVDMDSLMFGLYGGTSFDMKSPSDSMKLDAYASYGRFDNDSTHRSLSGNQTATASWKENAYAVGATLTRVHEVRENLFFSPFASLDYIYADMDSFTESAAQQIRYEGSAYQNLSLSVGTGLTRVYRLNGGQELSPFVSVAYVGDLVRKDAKVTSKNATGALIERSVSPGRNAFQVNVGTGWKITEQWGARVGYTAEFRSGATDQGVNVGVSYAF